MRLLFLLLFAVGVIPVQGLELLSVQRGSWTVRLLYNETALDQSQFQMVRVNQTTQEIWFMAVWSITEPTAVFWGCRIESTRPIVVGPRGCSDTENLQAALDSANCLSGSVEAEERLNLFLQTWQLDAFSAECQLQGVSEGDVRLCTGPLRLSQDNRDSFIPLLSPTQADLLSARYFFVDSYLGPYCASPTVIQVPMKRPSLRIVTGCLGEDGFPFDGSYEVFGNDPYADRIVDVWKVFQNSALPTFRFLLKRFGSPLSTSVNFKLFFAVQLGANTGDGYFDYWFESNETFTNISPQGVFGGADWLQTLDLTGATAYAFTGVGNGTGSCTATLEIEPETLYQLEPVFPPGASDYYLNKFPRVEWKDRVCGIFFGRADENLLEVLEYCPEGDKCGGQISYTHPEYPDLPVFVPEDLTLQYRFDCNEFYPQNTTFLDYGQDGTVGRTERQRMDVDRELCFAPFVVNQLITDALRPNERYIQCQKRGGYVFGRARAVCAKPITTQIECRLGWIYFDQRCFYKFSPTTENRFLSSLELADSTCEELFSSAVSLVQVDQYTETWLLDDFLYWKTDPDNPASYRIPDPDSPRGDCICFSTATLLRSRCACQEEHFPVCYYPIDAEDVVVPYQDVLVSLQTASVWQKGQEGPEFGGFQASCQCFDGWTGKNCERATCPLSRLIVDDEYLSESALSKQLTLAFFSRCYQNSRGACFNGQPRVCQCNYGYGPSASIMPSLPLLYEFKDWPCVCPAGTGTSGQFSINGQIFNSSQVIYLPCSGLQHGSCLAANTTSTLDAVCDSIDRENVNPSLPISEEPVYDGKATSCMRPLQPWQGHTINGPIVSNLCNSQGTCCPFGQNEANPDVGNLYDNVCFDLFGVPQQGCQCELGWGGEACTCPILFDVASGRLQREDTSLGAVVVDLGETLLVTQVNTTSTFGIGGGGCNVLRVELSNEPGRSVESVVCTLNTTLQTVWNCQEPETALAFRFLVIFPITTSSVDLTDCIVKAWTGPFFYYCGEPSHVNEFAGRFYDISAWRGVQFNLMQQFVYVANQGCTPSTCMCNSEWDGEKCKWGASSIRQTENAETGQLTWSKVLCGETVLVPVLENPVRGRGELGETGCDCNPISNVDPTGFVGRTTERFVGNACECVDVFVPELNDVVVCAGHGECQAVDLPMGRCELDFNDYLADSLSNPFVRVTGFADRDITLTLEQPGYFIAPAQDTLTPTASPTTPTLSPTVSPTFPPTPPTLSPTASPTTSPTTSPTASPTFPTEPLVLYAGPLAQLGDLVGTSTRGNLNALCGATPALCPSNSACMFISISGSPVTSCWSTLGVSVAAEIVGPTGTALAVNQADLADGSILVDFLTAGVLPVGPTQSQWWSGTTSALAHSGLDCLGWTSQSIVQQGTLGSRDDTDSRWVDDFSTSCNQQYATVCACQGSPPTQAPTASPSQSPTPSPTLPTASPTPPTSSPTIAPTVGLPDRVVLYENTPTMGFIQPTTSPVPDVRTNLNAFCTATQPSQCTGSSFLFVSVTGSTAGSVHTALGLPASAPVVGPTDIEIASSNGDLFDGSISVTLQSAGILSGAVLWWTGTDTDGSESINFCTSWTTASGAVDGTVGQSDATNFRWTDVDSFHPCDQDLATVCACMAGSPTSSPTASPTVPTASPTLTDAPTASPTPFVQPDPGLVLYRAAAGATFTADGVLDSVDYCPSQTENAPPTGLGLFTPGAEFVPIWWTDLVYLEWSSNATFTRNVSRCNPAYQAQPPGSALEDGPCPFLDSCGVLTNLDPASWTASLLAHDWPDLRGCVVSYSEEVRTDVGSLLSGEGYSSVQAQCVPSAVASGTAPAITNQFISFGVIQCNSFIDRTINCALFLLVPAYSLQCAQEPIQCFDFDVGKFFGGFDQQHPLVKFATVPRDRWELDKQYKMIASTVNNLFYSVKGAPIDPLTQELIWNDYIQSWVDSAGDITTTAIEIKTGDSRLQNHTLVSDLVQGRPTIYVNQEGEWQLDAVWGTDNQAAANECVDGVTASCYGLTYTAVSSAPLKLPGLWQAVQLEPDSYILTVQINTRFTGDVTGVELYNQNGGLCGSLLRPITLGETVYFSCVSTYGSTPVNGTLMWVRYLGVQPIWDIPQTVLGLGGEPTDDVAAVLQAGTDFTFGGSFNTVLTAFYGAWNLMATTWTELFGLSQPGALPKPAWPQRDGTLAGFSLVDFAQYNVTVAQGSPVLAGATAWDNITNSILLNFTYPFNFPLANSLGPEVETTAIDYSNQTHLDFLYGVWSTHLAPRQCGGDDSQCQQFGRGRCTFPVVDAFKQAWWQGEDPYAAPYVFQGNEGGCRCFNEFSRGFWDLIQACRTCEAGYGPATLDEWSRTIQYSELFNPLFDPTQFPFNQDFTGDPDKFWAEIACRLPYAKDPLISSLQDITLCAGHGNITTYTLTNTTFTTKVFQDSFGRNAVPLCTALSTQTDQNEVREWQLQSENITDASNLLYVSGNEMATVVNGALYFGNGTELCALQSCEQRWPSAPLCTYNCASEEVRVLCVNPTLFSYEAMNWRQNGQVVELNPIESTVFLAYF